MSDAFYIQFDTYSLIHQLQFQLLVFPPVKFYHESFNF
jgi:hypothetical protein